MIGEMVRRFLRQKFGNPIVAVTLAIIALMTSLPMALSGGGSGYQSSFLALILLAAGSVSRDASSGALQMILARPLRRTEYLYGRYAGILSAYAAFLAACAALTVLFARALLPALRVPVPPLDAGALARGLAGSFLGGVLFAAVLLFFSTFLPGYGDVLGYFLLAVGFSAAAGLGEALRNPGLARALQIAQSNVLPEVNWNEVLSGERSFGEPTGRWLFAVVVFLAAAALVFRRREFAYGQD